MNRWLTARDIWQTLIKDILLTGTGLTIIGWQVFLVQQPSTTDLGVGLALAGIGAGFHVGALVAGHTGGPSSSSHSPESPSPPPPSLEGNHQ